MTIRRNCVDVNRDKDRALNVGRQLFCYATFDRGLAQAEKVGVRGVGSIKFMRVPGEHSAFIEKNKRNKKMILNRMKWKITKKKMET
jgi:hypothetical protein